MFFIGVFGIDNKEKEIKILNNFCCKNCNESSEAKLIKTYSFFHFFFLPLFKWNEKYYVICNGCNSIFNIDKEKGKAIERGEKLEISYWDLKEVNNSYENYYIRKCPKCNRELENDFEYCPDYYKRNRISYCKCKKYCKQITMFYPPNLYLL